MTETATKATGVKTADAIPPLPAIVIENGVVLAVERKTFDPKSGGEPMAYFEAMVLVGLETYTATVDKSAIDDIRPMTQYARLRVELKGTGRQGGGHAVRLRIMEATV